MPNWTSSMIRSYEFYRVDPVTWTNQSRITTITGCSISRDLEKETLETASLSSTSDLGESYIRVYMVVSQNGSTERFPLGTFLTQTPSKSFNGKFTDVSTDAYSPLLELKNNQPVLGFTLFKGQNIMDSACPLVDENLRAPVSFTQSSDTLPDDFTSNIGDSWLSFIKDLISKAKYSYCLDEMGRVLFKPSQKLKDMTPIWTFDDSNSSILYPDIEDSSDIYGVPNVVEVVYSNGGECLTSTVINDDPTSIVSTVSRGRIIRYRDTSPAISGVPTQKMLDEYAEELLKNLSTLTHTVSYSHAYCPVRIGDCVRIDYKRAGLENIKAYVTSQSISCTPSGQVNETAAYTVELWRNN